MEIITFSSKLSKSRNNTHYIPVPEKVASEILSKFGKRVCCNVNGKTEIHCAVMRNRDLGYYITVGKKTQKKIGMDTGSFLQLDIRRDLSKYQAQLPEEFTAVLETDHQGSHLFEQLTDGKKRSIIHFIDSARSTDTRIERSLKIMEKLKLGVSDLRELIG